MRLPLLIGITGKRNLDPAERLSVEKRLCKLFRQLDADFPHVPKVLLTGAAYGADAIAAGLVCRNEGSGLPCFSDWSVVAILPFEQELFEKDFRPPSGTDPAATALAAERLADLTRLLSPQSRVRVRVLPALRVSAHPAADAVDQHLLDKDTPGVDAALRHQHYEQVGQCIAELSTILIAVMSGDEIANQREADGGTARIVAYRRMGRPDELGRAVACRSKVLRKDWGPLVDPPANYVWLVEPHRTSETAG